jgi:isoquinoline 1-oxidoreductase beta subunit
MDISLVINGQPQVLDIDPEMPLLWVLRDLLGLTGTKYGCGIGLCGSCTVLVDDKAVQSCTASASSMKGKAITTIEGLAEQGFHPVQDAWIAENVSQCGYCQSGQIISTVALLSQNPNPSPSEVDSAMSGNLCRCGTYQRIKRAIGRAATASQVSSGALVEVSDPAGAFLSEPGINRYLPALLPIAGAIAFTKDGDRNPVSRRGFLQVATAAGAGLIIGISLPGCSDQSDTTAVVSPTPAQSSSGGQGSVGNGGQTPDETTTTGTPAVTRSTQSEANATPEATAYFEPNLYLTIDNNGVPTVVVHRVEMGQGARTALPMMVAEELEVEWSSVRVVQSPGDSRYGKQQTAGSSCIYETFGPLRQAGAQAKEMLVMAAAQNWGVNKNTCYAENGTVIHEPSGRIAPYGELVESAATLPPTRGRLKDQSEFKIIGSRIGQFDSPELVTGSMVFGIDVMTPEMLFAAVARSPELRGVIVDYDSSETERVPGVRHIVPIESGVAIVADNTWAALRGKQILDITWESSGYSDLNSSELARQYREEITPGSTEANFLEAVYEVSFLAHATPSPMNCTADVRGDGSEVWAPTQAPQLAKSRASRIAGLSSEALTLHVPRLGGGFGRRLQVDYVRDAVEISREIGKPVKVMWSREDDIRHDYYHPLSVHHISADLTSRRLPHIRSRTFGEWDRITGAWRAVSNFTEGFVRECFIDEMAEYLDIDPLDLRLELLPRPFHAPLELAAEKAGWGAPLPKGRSRGIAAYATWDVTPVVMVAEVSLEDGSPRVHRVVTALDPGMTINPDLVEAQMEGGIVWGMSALMGSEITIVNGQVQQSNFHDYPILRFDEMPEIETHIVPSVQPPKGVGEMGVPPIAPAVLNALYGLTGQRIRTLPMRSSTG